MTLPDITVEVAFEASPYATSPTWTDVTDYVPQFQTKRGRNYELGQNEAGTLTLPFDNSDGRFDPLNTASPYYPYVLPYRQIRVRATYSGTTYDVWRGFVERWPQQWSANGALGVVDITAVDGFKTVLGKKFGQRYSDTVLADTPVIYARFDGTGSQTIGLDASGNSNSLTPTNTGFSARSNVTSLVNGLPNQSGQYTLSTTGGQTYNAGATGGSFGQPWSVEAWFRVDQWTFSTGGYVVRLFGQANQANIEIRSHTASPFGPRLFAKDTQSPTATSTDLGDLTVGSTYHVVLTKETDHKIRVYLNGTLVLTGATGTNFVPTGLSFLTGTSSATAYTACQITMDEAAVYERIISASTRYAAGGGTNYAEFASQTTSARVSAVLDAVAWPTAQRSIETGATTVDASGSTSGSTALSLLQAAAEAELGNVFLSGAGKFVFHNRAHRNSATSTATFGDGSAELNYVGDLTIDFDDTYVVNDVQVTRSGVSPAYVAQAFNSSSQTTYGIRSLQRSLPLSSSSDADGMAATLLAWYKDPRARVAEVTFEGHAENSLYPTLLGREIGDLVTVTRRPTGAPTITLTCFIDGVSHTVDAKQGTWVTKFMLTPQYPNATY